MSFISSWVENASVKTIVSVILNLLFQILDKGGKDGSQFYINTKWGKFVLDFDKVESKSDTDPDAMAQYIFPLDGIYVRVALKPNNA